MDQVALKATVVLSYSLQVDMSSQRTVNHQPGSQPYL